MIVFFIFLFSFVTLARLAFRNARQFMQVSQQRFSALSMATLPSTSAGADVRDGEVRQAEWKPKLIKERPQLFLYNSLTRSKTPFKPIDGNQVKFYVCGPTVYDQAHMGHARAYLSFDIIRRVLTRYFHYDLLYVMNVTDIDDKIIMRARQNAPEGSSERDVDGSDKSTYSKLAKHYEQDFFRDMRSLGVEWPDVVTRVSEYVQEIIAYVKGIIRNGYAYVTLSGSVYFDTAAFDSKPEHRYAKLVPEAYNRTHPGVAASKSHLVESEGHLSVDAEKLAEKRSPTDFALWKASKPDEPSWESPWGKGRPGWHIECSAMSSSVCGPLLDIHAGGFDLKFPHHDNEIAQCEAHADSPHWVNYFLHCGSLQIAGAKMSKSLKNFVSIKQVLQRYSADQIRLLCLMHRWMDTMEYSEPEMERVLQFEKYINEFFLSVADLLRREDSQEAFHKMCKRSDSERVLMDRFYTARGEVYSALCDSVDTRTVMERIRELIGLVNVYSAKKEQEGTGARLHIVNPIAAYVAEMLGMFGLGRYEARLASTREEPGEKRSINRERIILPYVKAIANFRENVRGLAKREKNTSILQACDLLRDKILPALGVRLEDKPSGTSIKIVGEGGEDSTETSKKDDGHE